MSLKTQLWLSVAVGTISMGLGGAAMAQSAAPSGSSSATVEEVIVTSDKRPENVQTVPQSVFVATKLVLDRANVRDFDDITSVAPDLTITKTTQPFNNSINIRGVGTYAFSIATEASTAVVVDDVPQAFQAQAFNALTDASQVEVLRGPQNTLFGRSASAGVISITTQAPTTTLQEGLRLMGTDDHERRVNAFISGPLTDTFKFRLALGADDYKGSLYNVFTQRQIDGHNDVNARAKFVWDVAPTWTVSLLPYWSNTHANCCTMTPYFLSPVDGGLTYGKFNAAKFAAPQALILNGIVPGPDNRQVSEDVNPEGNAVDYGSGFKIEHSLGGFDLLSVTSYDRYDLHDDQDTDLTAYNWGPGGPNPVPGAVVGGSANGGVFKISSVTQELRVTSPSMGRFRYVGGFFFSQTKGEATFVRGSNTLTQDGNLLTVPPTTSAYAAYISHSTDTNYALYGQSTFDVTDQLSLVTGLRLNRDKLHYNFTDEFNNVTFGAPQCSTKTPSGLVAPTCSTYDSVTGKVALQYRVTPTIMVFGGYDRGNKGPAFDLTSTLTTRTPLAAGVPLAGFPTADAIASRQPVPPETVDAYQLGFKSSFFDRRVIVNVTAFDAIYHNFQAQSRDDITQQNELNSIGQVTTKGVEFEIFTQLTHDLTFNLAGAYDKATIDSFPAAACFSGQTAALGCVNSQQDLSGTTLFNAPKFSISGNAEYDHPVADNLTGFITLTFKAQSSVYYSLLHDPDSKQSAYGLVNLGAGVKSGPWKARIFVNNLLDQSYATFLGRAGNWNINPYGATKGAPISDAINWTPGRDSKRYFGVELNYNY
ncbi:TonB-dependent receptor [Phenylobacterium sp.]|uniref:TonB-dependent receptor n=1 Tax=Phenylobacterium sp. TaxID=1871053 RepID=UPI002CDA85B6|nr:TonB-dependent receptor [Phenylobacterium sp.]HLZ77232.1 TonB-dependent receptor [Phenylobacterium sp.]